MFFKRFSIFFDTDDGGGVPAPETETKDAPEDSGRDVDELKAAIAAMQASINDLTAELQRKEPAPEPKADYATYFADYRPKTK